MGVSTGIAALVGDLGATGVGATLGTDALLGAGGGALLGGAEGALTGGNIGQDVLHGAEGGALTGGGVGAGGALLGDTLGATAADALGGAAGGALGGVATGSSPLTGAIGGAASGGLAGALSGPSNAGTYGATGGPSGAAAPVPSSVAPSTGDVSLDTSSLNPSQFSTLNGGGSSPASVAQSIGAVPGSTATAGNTVGTSNIPDLAGATAGSPANAGTFGQANSSAIGTGGTGATGAADNFAANVNGTSPSLASAANEASGGGLSLGSLENGAIKSLTDNPIGLAASGLGLGVDALKEGQMVKGQRQLQQEAGAEANQGAQLESYLQNGTLPPGLQAGVDQATQSAIASIKSQYAARGMSGSSAESQDIAAAQQRAQAQGAQMAMQLLNTGVQETGMSSELYKAIMGNALQQDQNLGSAISGFAQAAAGGVPQKQTQPAS